MGIEVKKKGAPESKPEDNPETRKRPPVREIYRRVDKWVLFVASCIRMLLFSGSLKANGVFLDELVEFLDTRHSLVAWALSLQSGLPYLLAPVVRMLLLVVSHRKLSVVGGFLTGAGYIYSGIFATSVVHIFIGYGLTGIGYGMLALPAYLVLQKLFREHFPTAASAVGLFTFVGMAIMPPVVKYFDSVYGLRNSMILLGALLWNEIACGAALRLRSDNIKTLENLPVKEIQNGGKRGDTDDKNVSEMINEEPGQTCLQKYLPFFSSVFAHKGYAVLLVFSAANEFVLTSWVIFLVSFGKDIGLSEEAAVSLSSAGGIGGLVGRVTTVAIFYFDRDGPYVACFPSLLSGLLLLSCTIARNFTVIAALTFLFGLTLGLGIGILYGIIALTVCQYHFPQALAILGVVEGIIMQCSGILSGIIHDVFGSSVYVFAFNAAVLFLVSPLMFAWRSNDVKDCKPENYQNRKQSAL